MTKSWKIKRRDVSLWYLPPPSPGLWDCGTSSTTDRCSSELTWLIKYDGNWWTGRTFKALEALKWPLWIYSLYSILIILGKRRRPQNIHPTTEQDSREDEEDNDDTSDVSAWILVSSDIIITNAPQDCHNLHPACSSSFYTNWSAGCGEYFLCRV